MVEPYKANPNILPIFDKKDLFEFYIVKTVTDEDIIMKKIISKWFLLLFSITCIFASISFSVVNIMAK